MRRLAGALAALAAAALVAACSGATPSATSAVPSATSAGPSATSAGPSTRSLPVAHAVTWVCRPGGPGDACTRNLDAVAVTPTGRTAIPFTPAADPKVDCFYVYPTVSRAAGTNAPDTAEPAVVAAVRAQAALFGSTCRVFAPVYRQVTLHALATGAYFDPAAQQRAYDDVVSAWHSYLNDDPGRPVVLIGHSQGAMLLARLLSDDVAQHPEVRSRIVSALLMGGSVTVPDGSDVADHAGGLPACRRPGQTRCVVAYSSFAAEPPQDAYFGRAAPGRTALCTDPTRLAGGDGALHPELPTSRLGPAGGLERALPAPSGTTAAFVAYPGAARGECRTQEGASWLQVTPVPGAALSGTQITSATAGLSAQWGLHAVDVTLALGDLVEVVRRQGAAWPG